MSILFFRFDPEKIHIITRSGRFSMYTFEYFNGEVLYWFYELPKKIYASQYPESENIICKIV